MRHNGALRLRLASTARAPRSLAPLGLAIVLLALPFAGCFERNGTLAIDLKVSGDGSVGDFRSLNITLKDVRIKAKTLNPEFFPASVTRLELTQSVGGAAVEVFKQTVRSDNYQKIEVTTQGSSFQGVLRDGTNVGVVVPNADFIVTTDFNVPRGGTAAYTIALKVNKVDTGQGQPTYTIIADPEASSVQTS